jgi:hypothetical protein
MRECGRMKIGFHGGLCCGVKHIYGLGSCPDYTIYARLKVGNGAPPGNDLAGHDFQSQTDFFRAAAPSETYLQRLDRYIAYLDKYRKGCVIEVCLAEYNWDCQVKAWGKLLEERGFKEIHRFKNNNSGMFVRIYHRLEGEDNGS